MGITSSSLYSDLKESLEDRGDDRSLRDQRPNSAEPAEPGQPERGPEDQSSDEEDEPDPSKDSFGLAESNSSPPSSLPCAHITLDNHCFAQNTAGENNEQSEPTIQVQPLDEKSSASSAALPTLSVPPTPPLYVVTGEIVFGYSSSLEEAVKYVNNRINHDLIRCYINREYTEREDLIEYANKDGLHEPRYVSTVYKYESGVFFRSRVIVSQYVIWNTRPLF